MGRGFKLFFALAPLFVASVAHAEGEDADPPRKLVLRPRVEEGSESPVLSAEETRKHAEQRPFVYAMDPTTPSKGDTSVEYGLGLAAGVSADRPLPQALGYDGAVHSITLGYGATAGITPFVSARMLQPTSEGDKVQGGGAVGLRVQLTDPNSKFRLTLAGAGSREFGGTMVTWGKVAASYDIDRLRVVGNLHFEHAFASDRDPVDLLVIVGASYRTLDVLRVGAEYVGQDLEEIGDSGAEGGARHYVGPTVAVDLDGGTFQVVGGPAFGIGRQTHGNVLGRLALVANF